MIHLANSDTCAPSSSSPGNCLKPSHSCASLSSSAPPPHLSKSSSALEPLRRTAARTTPSNCSLARFVAWEVWDRTASVAAWHLRSMDCTRVESLINSTLACPDPLRASCATNASATFARASCKSLSAPAASARTASNCARVASASSPGLRLNMLPSFTRSMTSLARFSAVATAIVPAARHFENMASARASRSTLTSSSRRCTTDVMVFAIRFLNCSAFIWWTLALELSLKSVFRASERGPRGPSASSSDFFDAMVAIFAHLPAILARKACKLSAVAKPALEVPGDQSSRVASPASFRKATQATLLSRWRRHRAQPPPTPASALFSSNILTISPSSKKESGMCSPGPEAKGVRRLHNQCS
mmetsp:Transcript_83287/g.232246  ORF Transcript_83287/g.232246 Transcript_83287/m.232246 type:complete len:360 (+) Transcript_83287:1098-2177(+)